MGEQVQRLTKLATDLLDLSRLDAGGITIAHDEIELGELAADSAREMQALAARRGSSVVVEMGAPAPARGDEGRVLQVLRVLVDNAVRHTPPGSTVTLRTETTPWGASVIVSDDGPGIPPELLERVFERFFRGPGAAARGTGLGLAIARELAERMDGRLLATSGPGGTRFTLELPGPWPGRDTRLHWVPVTARAALAGAAIALVAGLAGALAALALRGDGGERSVVTTVVRSGGASGFDPVALYAGARNGVVTIEASFGVDDQTSGQRLRRRRAPGPDRDRLARRRRGRGGSTSATQATAVRIVLDDGTRADAKVLGYDLFEDTALLQVDPAQLGLRALPLGRARALRVGEPVAVIGSPFENRASLSTGVVSQLDRQIAAPGVCFRTTGVIQTDAAVNPGNSGGPLLDAQRARRRHGHRGQPGRPRRRRLRRADRGGAAGLPRARGRPARPLRLARRRRPRP